MSLSRSVDMIRPKRRYGRKLIIQLLFEVFVTDNSGQTIMTVNSIRVHLNQIIHHHGRITYVAIWRSLRVDLGTVRSLGGSSA